MLLLENVGESSERGSNAGAITNNEGKCMYD